MPNDNQLAKSYIEAAMARADINALAAKAQLEAVRTALGGYKDSDLASLATTLKARLDKATELLRAALGRSECYDEDHECGETDTTRAIRAFLDERK